MSGQLTAMTIMVALVPLFCLATLGYVFHDTAYRDKTHSLLGAQTMSAAQSINAFLEEKLSNLRQEASASSLAALSGSAYLRDRLHALQNVYQGVFLDLDLLDSSGTVIAYTGGDAPQNQSREAWFQNAINRPQFVSGLALRDEHLFIAVRITARNSAWLLRAHLDPVQIDDRLRAFHPGGQGSAFFLDRQGGPGKPGPEAGETARLLARQVFPEGRPVVLEAADASGKPAMFGCAPLKATGGMLVLQQPRQEALLALNKVRVVAVAIVVLGIAGIVATAVAMSRRTEQRLRKAEFVQQQMQRQVVEAGKLAAIGELAAGVAHEINNPLAIMMENAGWIQDLLKSEDLQSEDTMEEIQASLQTITTQGHRCREITHKLLSFARKSDNTPRAVQINQLLEDIAGFARQKAKYKGVEIRLDLDPQAGDAEGSPSELQQIVLNLVNNAIDAIERENGLVLLHSYGRDGFVCIDVEDNGPGIPQDILPRIFEPFFTTKAIGKGTGLGLAICKDILARMGGDISVESRPGQGAAFRVRIPRSARV